MEQYPWLKHYPEGVAHEINPDQYSSLLDLIEASFQEYGTATAYENMGVKLSFQDVKALSEAFAVYLQNNTNLKKGDRLAIQMPNLLQYPVVLFGALRAGLTVVNVNPLYTPREMAHQFNDSGSKAVVILANFAANLQKVVKETQLETVIITEIGDLFPGFKGTITNFVVKKVKKMVPAYSIPSALKLKDVLKAGKKGRYTRPTLTLQDVAVLQYTGGTTGVSKGATLTHRNLVANTLQTQAWFYGLEKGKDVVITALPLYHIFALTANCLLMLKSGVHNILITNPMTCQALSKS